MTTAHYDLEILRTNESVSVPAGTFNNCVHVSNHREAEIGDTHVSEQSDEWFALDVGIVKTTQKFTASKAGGNSVSTVVRKLKSFH